MRARLLVVAFVCAMMEAHAAGAEVVTWIGPSTGLWRVPANWSPHEPTEFDDVVIPGGVVVTFEGFGADRSVSGVTGDGSLEIAQGTLRVSGSIDLGSTRVRNAGLVGATMESDLIYGPDSGFDSQTLERVAIAAGATLRPGTSSAVNAINLNVVDGLRIDGIFIVGNQSKPSVVLFSGTQSFDGTGEVHLGSAGNLLRPTRYDTLQIAASLTIRNSSQATIGWTNGSVANEYGTVINHAMIETDTAGAETMLSGVFVNQGTLKAVKNTRITALQTFIQHQTGVLDLFVGGIQPADLGWFRATRLSGSPVSISGTLRATVEPGYVPSGGESFRVMTYNQGTFPGVFTSLDLPSHWYPDYGSQAGTPRQYVDLRIRSIANPPTDVGVGDGKVLATGLVGALPNPFGAATILNYSVARPTNVQLVILDVRGRIVRNLGNGMRDRGVYQTAWDGNDDAGRAVPSGVYTCVMQTTGRREAHKVILLR